MPTTATDRLVSEKAFHDEQAQSRRKVFARQLDSFRFDEDWYLVHEPWIRPAFAKLGTVAGLQVLDLGCGHGMASIYLARRKAWVTSLDLSPAYLNEAAERARLDGVDGRIRFVQAPAETLPFAEASFDRVWGNAILHHLELATAGRELARVLKPGGVAVFCEPWGENPLLEWARHWLPYPGKMRSADERPLRKSDLNVIAGHFAHVETETFQLFGMARRLFFRERPKRPRYPFALLDRCDAACLQRWPALRDYCRYVVLRLRR